MNKYGDSIVCSLVGGEISKLLSKDSTLDEKIDPYVKKLFAKVFTGMNGRYTRLKIIKVLIEEPSNINQLSQKLGMEYKGIQHNMKILQTNYLVDVFGDGYGKMYFASELLMKNLKSLDAVLNKVDIEINKKKVYF
jgi:DNA-binding transcriptional ArsR family regulator